MPNSKSSKPIIQVVAILEATKGLAVLLTGFGALSFMHQNVQQLAEKLVGNLHLNPAKHYPHIFLDFAAHATDTRLMLFALLAITYSTIRIIEAYGLWHNKRWAEWFAAISGGIYIPFELYDLFRNPSPLIFLLLLINSFIVAYMINALLRNPAHKLSKGT